MGESRPPELERIVVIGTSCAGKSTFARQLSKKLSLEYVELDVLFWAPQWQPKPLAEFHQVATQTVARPNWIVEGNYGSARDMLWPRATTIIWLNYSFSTVLWRALRRTVHRAVTRQTLWHGNKESIRRSFFSRKSILAWIIKTFHSCQRESSALRADEKYAQLNWLEFTTPFETSSYLNSI